MQEFKTDPDGNDMTIIALRPTAADKAAGFAVAAQIFYEYSTERPINGQMYHLLSHGLAAMYGAHCFALGYAAAQKGLPLSAGLVDVPEKEKAAAGADSLNH